jgi:putative membrane protein
MWGWHDWAMGPWDWIGGLLGIFFFIAFVVLVIWGITKLVQRESSSGGEQRKSPLDIAKERYAKGEITKEEFDAMRKELT